MKQAPRTLVPVDPDEFEQALAAALCSGSRRALTAADEILIFAVAERVSTQLAAAGIVPFRQSTVRQGVFGAPGAAARVIDHVVAAALSLSDVLPPGQRHRHA